jgi:hypothetical protein
MQLSPYFTTHDWLDLSLVLADGVIATLIVLRLLFPAIAAGTPVSWPARALRLGIALVYTTIAVRVWGGWYWLPVDPSELLPHALTLALVLTTRGDMRSLLRALGGS